MCVRKNGSLHVSSTVNLWRATHPPLTHKFLYLGFLKYSMSYLIRRVGEKEPKQIICGIVEELTTAEDFADVDIAYVKITGGTKKHYHKKMVEFYYVLDGKLDVELDDAKEECPAGTLIMIKPGTKHKAHGNANILVVCSPAFSLEDEFVVE